MRQAAPGGGRGLGGSAVARAIALGPVVRNLVAVRRLARAGATQLDERQRRALVRLVRHAATAVPHYRRAIGPDVAAAFSGVGDLARLPVLDRAELNRQSGRDVLADGFTVETTKPATTSGSSGVPVTVRNSERDLGYLRAAYLDDMLAAGLRPWDRIAYFRVNPFLHHPLERFGVLPTFHVDTSGTLDEQVDAFLAARPTFVVGFPTIIYGIVEELERRGVRYRGVRNVLFGGERLTPAARARIVEHFDARASEVYATVEAFTIARSCRHGRLHLRRADVVLEVEHDDGTVSVEAGEGEALVTRLRSEAMPLIRYRLGDRVSVVPPGCPCGAPTPVVEAVQGRSEDRLLAPDGRPVYGDFVTYAVHDYPEVRRMQLTQHRPGQLALHVVTVDDPRPDLLADLRSSVLTAVPGWDVEVSAVDAIAPEPNGKIKVVKVRHGGADGAGDTDVPGGAGEAAGAGGADGAPDGQDGVRAPGSAGPPDAWEEHDRARPTGAARPRGSAPRAAP